MDIYMVTHEYEYNDPPLAIVALFSNKEDAEKCKRIYEIECIDDDDYGAYVNIRKYAVDGWGFSLDYMSATYYPDSDEVYLSITLRDFVTEERMDVLGAFCCDVAIDEPEVMEQAVRDKYKKWKADHNA